MRGSRPGWEKVWKWIWHETFESSDSNLKPTLCYSPLGQRPRHTQQRARRWCCLGFWAVRVYTTWLTHSLTHCGSNLLLSLVFFVPQQQNNLEECFISLDSCQWVSSVIILLNSFWKYIFGHKFYIYTRPFLRWCHCSRHCLNLPCCVPVDEESGF